MSEFDIMIHLGGEQNLPNLLAMKIFPCTSHFIVITEKTKDKNKFLQSFTDLGTIELILLHNPFDFDMIVKVIGNAIEGITYNSIAFNITGGTKIMSLAAIKVATDSSTPYFYINTDEECALCWNYRVKNLSFPRPLLQINDFFAASGHELVSNVVHTAATREDSEYIFTNNTLYKRLQNNIVKARKKRERKRIDRKEFIRLLSECSTRDSSTGLDSSNTESIILSIAEQSRAITLDATSYRDKLQWLTGGWFEEYLFYQLRDFLDTGKISELGIGVKVKWNTRAQKSPDDVKQELDIVFTDGIRLWILEVKTGKITQSDFQKLENNCATFAGGLSCGILVSLMEKGEGNDSEFLERVKGSYKVAMLNGNIADKINIDTLKNLKPKQII